MKSLFEQFVGTYRKQNDYVIPNFEMPDIANLEIGFYGQRHLYFLQNYRKVTYKYLVEIDKQAQKRFFRIVE